ncbi:hypothetical protein OAJ39_01555 [Alphaproteobacteria bacterium]|nr:hypothetical protein [Alphaproteobacteria bacterium]
MKRFLKRIILIFSPLIRGDFKSFTLEMKLWGPEVYKRYIWRKHCEGFLLLSPDTLPEGAAKGLYQEFYKKDFVKISGQNELVDFCNNVKSTEPVTDEFGRTKTILTGLTSEALERHTSPIVSEVLRLIYGRPFWIRDKAFIMEHSPNKAKDHIQADWHVDGYNQVTLTLLLKDSQQDPVATEMMAGSSKTPWPFDRRLVEVGDDYETAKFSGKKGDLFIFFGGGALHRSYIGSSGRKAVFVNLSSGWYESGLI